MAYKSPLLDENTGSLTGLNMGPYTEPFNPAQGAVNQTQVATAPQPDQSGWVTGDQRLQQLMKSEETPSQNDGWITGEERLNQLSSGLPKTAEETPTLEEKLYEVPTTDAMSQQMWEEYNRPEDELILASEKSVPKYMGELATGVIDKAKAVEEWKVGLGENLLTGLVKGVGVDFAAGTAGLAKLISPVMKNPKSATALAKILFARSVQNPKEVADMLGDIYENSSADEVAEVIENTQEYLAPKIGPQTPKGKEMEKDIALGAETIVGPIARWGKKEIKEPATKWAAEKMGPTGSGLVAAGIAMAPEIIGYILAKGPGTGPVRTALKGTAKTAASPITWGAGKVGLTGERMARWVPTLTVEGAVKKAREFVKRGMPEGTKVSAEVADLEREIPGLRLNSIVAFDEPGTRQMWTDLARKDQKTAISILENQRHNYEVMTEYLRSAKPVGDPIDIRVALMRDEFRRRGFQVTSEEQAGVYKKAVEKSVKRKGLTVPETGEVLKKGFWKEMKAARNKATELVNQLEDDFIPSKGIVEDLREVLKMESGSEIPSKGIPAELEKGIKDISSGSVTTVKELYKHRKTWRRAYDQMTSPRGEPNYFAENRLRDAIEVLDKHMKNAILKPGKAADLLEKFRRQFFGEVIAKYENPLMRKLLDRSVKHGDAISRSMVGGKFMKKGFEGTDTARDFIKSSNGNPDMLKALEAYIDQDMLRSVFEEGTNNLSKSKLQKWLHDYEPFIKELGIENRFSTIKKIQKKIDDAKLLVDEFEKRTLSKIRGADIDMEMYDLLKGKTPNRDMRDLMAYYGKDPRIIKAVQSSLIDQVEAIVVESSADVKDLYKLFRKNKDLYKTAFKKNPEKVTQIERYIKGMERLFPEGSVPSEWSDLGKIFGGYLNKRQLGHSLATLMERTAIESMPSIGRRQVQDIIRKLALDPRGTEMIRQSAKDYMRKRPDLARTKMLHYMLQIGVPAATKLALDSADKNKPATATAPQINTNKNMSQDAIKDLIQGWE